MFNLHSTFRVSSYPENSVSVATRRCSLSAVHKYPLSASAKGIYILMSQEAHTWRYNFSPKLTSLEAILSYPDIEGLAFRVRYSI
jgi:hypothetical protein